MNDTDIAVDAIDTVDEVTVTVLQTVFGMWQSFLEHIPYICRCSGAADNVVSQLSN